MGGYMPIYPLGRTVSLGFKKYTGEYFSGFLTGKQPYPGLSKAGQRRPHGLSPGMFLLS